MSDVDPIIERLVSEVAALRQRVLDLERGESQTTLSALNVGTATGAATGVIKASADIAATNTLSVATSATGLPLRVVGDGVEGGGIFITYRTGGQGRFVFQSARGSAATPSALQATDDMLNLATAGWQDTTSAFTANIGTIKVVADEAFTSTAAGRHIELASVAVGGTARVLGLTVGPGAKVGFNGAAAQGVFVSGGAAPAGGTGTAAGGWDTAAHRDSAITLLNNIRTALINLGLMS